VVGDLDRQHAHFALDEVSIDVSATAAQHRAHVLQIEAARDPEC
jgi:hypothetical protein